MADEEINRKENSFHEENEFIIDTDLVIKCSDWNPLHVAASRGLRGLFKRLLAGNPELAEALDSLMAASGEQQELFKKLLHGNPELAEALDSQQRSLLHLASAKGHIDIAKALTEVRPEMCLARDRDGANPLHVAAMRGKVEVLDVLFQANPHAARARVDRGERETILHLCVKYNKLAFLKQLLEKFKSDEFVNAKDDGGNTILHLAVSDQKFEIIDLVLKKTKIDVNATNAIKQTAMGIHYLRQGIEPEGADRDIEDLLLKFHAKREKDTIDPKWITEQRNALIIVAVLLATIAFQAGVTPPGGVWAEDSKGTQEWRSCDGS
ncbi:hypothetical protein Vadar_009938 [Vaccinium darrowii]|uniref:Uncharacterized protein n=1 Tax=Vaccinium darrowii TaxID=229202 RepID=A0ACB7X8Q3_9ERIC|nr:hypothetical protein Vadar_009938 [Vaccinium darrowii]